MSQAASTIPSRLACPERTQKLLMEKVPCAVCGSENYTAAAEGRDYQYWTSNDLFVMVQCRACGHLYLNPRPTPDSASVIYPPDYYTLAGRHAGQGSRLIAALKRRVVLRRLAAFRELLNRPVRVLEVGCGDCALLLALRRSFPAVGLTGVDLAMPKDVARECRSRGIELVQGPIEDVALEAGAYSLVVMNQLIEHLWDPAGVLDKVHAGMAPGGMLSIETVNAAAYDRRLIRDGRWGAFYFPRHLNLFDSAGLGRLLAGHGFEVVRQYSLVGPVNWAFSLRALTCPDPRHRDSRWHRLLSDESPACLAVFTVLDLLARAVGLTTSNQKTIARKV